MKGLKLIQDDELFCFGTDAVLLADFAQIRKGDRVADLGCAVGILPILLYGRQPEACYAGIEIQQPLAELAQRNVALNSLQEFIRVEQGDIRDAVGLLGQGYSVVVANPPYEREGEGAARPGESHKIARKEVKITFWELCVAAAKLLRAGGRFYMIHKAARLPELMETLRRHRLEPKTLRFVHNRIGSEAKYVLICAVRDAGEFMRVMPPLVMQNGDGTETPEMKKIYHRE